MAAANAGANALELLALRRSTPIKLLGGAGPSKARRGTAGTAARLSDDVILKGLRDIAATMRSRYELSRLALVIRSGALKIGDTKTCIAVSGHDWKTVAAAADAASRLVKSEYSFHSP